MTAVTAQNDQMNSKQRAKRGARKAFRECLNELGRGGKWRNGRHQQRTRAYGDYLYFQDRDMFEVEFQEAMNGNYAARGFDAAKWRRTLP